MSIDRQAVYDSYVHLHSIRGWSVDDILIEPPYRAEFVATVNQHTAQPVPENQALRTLVKLRKQSKLSAAALAGAKAP